MHPRHGRRIGGLLLTLALSAALLPSYPLAAADPLALAETHLDDADLVWEAASEIAVSLASGASSGGGGVTADGDVVTIASPGTYHLTGSLADGQVVVESPGEGVVRLILDGVSITSSTTSPLSVTDADEVVVILADGSQNQLVDAETYVDPSPDVDEPKAALFSTADLTIAGTGSLTVAGRANDGISSKDGLIIAGGSITVSAVDDGIRGKDYLVIGEATISVQAGGDALKADNEEDVTLGSIRIDGGTLDLASGVDAIDGTSAVVLNGGVITIDAGDDGIHAEARLEINGGTIAITRSEEGLEGTEIVITGGDTSVVSSDDGLNVAGGTSTDGAGGGRGGGGGESAQAGWFVEMTGGTLIIDSDGDGIDSNGSAFITGGTILVDGPMESMNGAIDVNGELLISDGLLVAVGSALMAEAPSDASEQATVAVAFDGTQPAGTLVRVQSTDGTNVVTYVAAKGFETLVVSSPDLVAGDTYEILVGGSATGDRLGGLYPDPTYTAGELAGTITAS